MGKVAQAVIAGYWPDRVPRRIAVPQRPLAKLFDKAVSRAEGGQPAVVSPADLVPYDDYFAETDRLAAGIILATGPKAAMAVMDPAPIDELQTLVAGLLAGCKVAVLAPERPEAIAAWNAAVPPELFVAPGEMSRWLGGFEDVLKTRKDLLAVEDGTSTTRRAARWREVAIRIPSDGSLVGHSHAGIAAMSTNMGTFIPLLKELDFVCTRSLSSWDQLTGALTALFSSQAVVFDPAECSTWNPAKAFAIITREEADEIVKAGEGPAYLSSLRLLFVSVSDYDMKWRTKLEDALGRIVLPIWGAPEVGPAVAAHPQWVPIEMHGLPFTNVDMVPVDPESGAASDVPWEMLDSAELGIQSTSLLLELAGRDIDDIKTKCRRGTPLVRTDQIVFVDRLGLVRFLG